MLAVQNLSVKYANEKKFALNSINFSANLGEFIVIAGSSGSGKSTLAQALLGLIPDFIKAELSGDIKYQNNSLKHLSRKERIEKLGYIPQYPSDYTTSLLVEEEIAFVLENMRISPIEIRNRIRETLSLLEISKLHNRLVTELSSGELQRVFLASSLVYRPPILILDEPIARIDPKTEVKLSNILAGLAKRGHLVIAFEHRLDYILAKASRLLILDKGRLIADGKPGENVQLLEQIDPPEIFSVNQLNKINNALSIEEAINIYSKKDLRLFQKKKNFAETMNSKPPLEKISVHLKNISFSYKSASNYVLQNINLSLHKGEIVGFMGVNGCGKSTLFRIISGILKAKKGEIFLNNQRIKRAGKAKKHLAFVPENAKLFLTGPTPEKDLEKILQDKKKVESIYSKYSLLNLSKKKLYHLSEGERRLFAIINSFYLDRRIILLDEPTIGIDKTGRKILFDLLQKAKRELKVVCLASNDPRIFPELDRLIVIDNQRILFDGTPRDILYKLENNTKLLPNQIVRLVQKLEQKFNCELPHIISLKELEEIPERS
ncbi:MAG: ABC transporter ATP-binding protein [Candidatus Heimdallarchaeaceae archaeon]